MYLSVLFFFLPFSHIGDSVPQLSLSTQEVAIFTSADPIICLYQFCCSFESQWRNDLSLHLVDRSPETWRINRFASSHGSEVFISINNNVNWFEWVSNWTENIYFLKWLIVYRYILRWRTIPTRFRTFHIVTYKNTKAIMITKSSFKIILKSEKHVKRNI